MKKLLLLLLIAPMFGFGQGEQRYADGTATDQDGNTFEWINYGTQDWAIENADRINKKNIKTGNILIVIIILSMLVGYFLNN